MREQTVLPHEVILVEDFSEDGTLEALHFLRQNIDGLNIIIEQHSANKGASVARNTGWQVASQPFIAFLDADDTWHPRKLEIQYSWMRRNPDVCLTGHVCSEWSQETLRKTENDIKEGVAFNKIKFSQLLLSNRFSTPSVMLRTEVPFRFNTEMRRCEDYLLWCEIVGHGGKAYQTSVPLAFVHKNLFGEAGLTGNLCAMEKDELRVLGLLERQKIVSPSHRLMLSAWSLLKYVRRLILTKYRRALQ